MIVRQKASLSTPSPTPTASAASSLRSLDSPTVSCSSSSPTASPHSPDQPVSTPQRRPSEDQLQRDLNTDFLATGIPQLPSGYFPPEAKGSEPSDNTVVANSPCRDDYPINSNSRKNRERHRPRGLLLRSTSKDVDIYRDVSLSVQPTPSAHDTDLFKKSSSRKLLSQAPVNSRTGGKNATNSLWGQSWSKALRDEFFQDTVITLAYTCLICGVMMIIFSFMLYFNLIPGYDFSEQL